VRSGWANRPRGFDSHIYVYGRCVTQGSDKRKWRLGVVSFLNAKPLIAGLETETDIELVLEVPARLPDLLDRGVVDVALVPVVDLFQNESRWKIVSDACIGCDGETMTVRVFSRVPPEAVRTLAADTDSHSSVMLARLLWQERFGRKLEITPLSDPTSAADSDAILLIGDKVVARPESPSLSRFNLETDVGSMWKDMFSLPLVFAVWAAPRTFDTSRLELRLSAARDRGVQSASEIASEIGPALGWPVALAEQYLTRRLLYTLGPPQRRGMDKFRELAMKHGLLRLLETAASK